MTTKEDTLISSHSMFFIVVMDAITYITNVRRNGDGSTIYSNFYN